MRCNVRGRFRLLVLLGSVWALIAGCKQPNTLPTASIDYPEAGSKLYPKPLTLRGTVSDAETASDSLDAEFSAGEGLSCSVGPNEEGEVSCEIPFDSEGIFTVELWVVDEDGGTGDAEVEIELYDNPPSLAIISPNPSSPAPVNEQDLIAFISRVEDLDEEVLTCVWESSIDGELGSAVADSVTGECSITDVQLSRGTHGVTSRVIDEFGKEASVSFQIPVGRCTDDDQDGIAADCGEERDCADNDASVYPGAVEACDLVDRDCNGEVDDIDADNDGHSACSDDCDDTNPLIHGSAQELCDDVDNDCDGEVDEGFDKDNDLYPSCQECDDENRDVNPGADEICDDVDNDCDGEVDEGVRITLYPDADGDGFGDGVFPTSACSVSLELVENGDDCDDANPEVNPAATEICNGVDDNCDAQIDEGTSPITFYQDLDGDGYGDSSGPTEVTCTSSEGFVSEGGDCDDANAQVNPGATEVCDGTDDDCDGQTDEGVILTYYEDGDGDGFGVNAPETTGCTLPDGWVETSGDCGDSSPDIYPGAPEQCNEIDDDCDGTVDNDVQTYTFYRDGDGDGYGRSTGDTEIACTAPSGYVLNSDDCDDTDPAINPGGAESCNGKDDDCDSQFDEGVQTQYWPDTDADGHGDGDSLDFVWACAPPGGYVLSSDDCDDSNATVYYGAAELCDGMDTNCNGVVDEGHPQRAFYLDQDGDGFGSSDPDDYFNACALPSGYSTTQNDCDDTRATVYPGATELPNGIDDDCDNTVDEGTVNYDDDGDGFSEAGNPSDCNDQDASIFPAAGGDPGAPETLDGVDEDCDGIVDNDTTCWDDDGDGYLEQAAATSCPGYPEAFGGNIPGGNDCNDFSPDVYPGAPERFNGVDDSCDSQIDGTISLDDHTIILTGDEEKSEAGWAVAGLGDVNGDGLGDFGIGAPGRGIGRGAAHVIFGRSGVWQSGLITDIGITLEGDSSGSAAGFAITATNLDDDDYDDIVISAPFRDSGSTKPETGRLYLLYGKETGWSGGSLNALASAFEDGLAEATYMGYSLSGGEDVDNDGVEDLAVGIPWTDAGYLAILPGLDGGRYTTNDISPASFAKVVGYTGPLGTPGDELGYSVAMVGNGNGDKWPDILVAGKGNLGSGGREDAGMFYFVPGYKNLVPELGVEYPPDALGAVAYRGELDSGEVGFSTSGAGNVNGDAYDDFLIGRGKQTDGEQGLAYLFLGGAIPAASSVQEAAHVMFTGPADSCPCTVAGLGDVDCDGYSDIAIGASGADEGGLESGTVYLFYGKATGWTGPISLDDADAKFIGTVGEAAGADIAGFGDVNGDNCDDFGIGAPGYSAEGDIEPARGRVFLFLGFPRS